MDKLNKDYTDSKTGIEFQYKYISPFKNVLSVNRGCVADYDCTKNNKNVEQFNIACAFSQEVDKDGKP